MNENGAWSWLGFGIGILVGAAVGVSVGMLYAPRSGKETRHMVAERTGEMGHKASEMVGKARGRVMEMAHRGQEKAQEIRTEASQ